MKLIITVFQITYCFLQTYTFLIDHDLIFLGRQWETGRDMWMDLDKYSIASDGCVSCQLSTYQLTCEWLAPCERGCSLVEGTSVLGMIEINGGLA